MRLITFIILSAGIALSSIPAYASLASNTFRQTSVSSNCPIYEGYPDCHDDGGAVWTTYSNSRRLAVS